MIIPIPPDVFYTFSWKVARVIGPRVELRDSPRVYYNLLFPFDSDTGDVETKSFTPDTWSS